jgi:hypothetical protein
MRRIGQVLAVLGVFGSGYLLGSFHSGNASALQAVQQRTGAESVSDDTLFAYQRFVKGGNELSDSLAAESLNTLAVEGRNYFALSVGGVDAVRDLEENRGVDPETFGAIYADRATPEVTEHITTDSLGRKLYKGNIVRLYPRERLKEVFQRRDQMDVRSKRIGG